MENQNQDQLRQKQNQDRAVNKNNYNNNNVKGRKYQNNYVNNNNVYNNNYNKGRNYNRGYQNNQNFRNFPGQNNFYQNQNQNFIQGFPQQYQQQQMMQNNGMMPISNQMTFQQQHFMNNGYNNVNFKNFYGMKQNMMQQKGYKYKLQFKGTPGQQKEVIQKLQKHNKFKFEQISIMNNKQQQQLQNGLIKFQYILTFQDKQEAKKCMFHNHLRHIKLQEEQNRPKLIMKRIVTPIGQEKIQENNRVQVEAQEDSEGGVRGIYLFAIKSGVVYKVEQVRNERGKFQIYFESNIAAKKFVQQAKDGQLQGKIIEFQKEKNIDLKILDFSEGLDQPFEEQKNNQEEGQQEEELSESNMETKDIKDNQSDISQ